MTEVILRCRTCGQPLPTLTRTELGSRFVRLLHPDSEETDGGFEIDGKSVAVRTSKLNAQSDRPTRRWSFSKGSGDTDPDEWFWIGLSSAGDRVLRAWIVPAAEWTTRVTHVSESPTSQWAPFQTFPSSEHPEPLAAHEIQESIMVAQPLTARNFQRGTFKRYVAIMKFNIGSLSNSQTPVDIERNEYVHFDGYTLRFNGDSPNQADWVDYRNVASRTIVSAINNGWLVEVPEGVAVDVNQWNFQPPSANIQMSAADPYKAQQQGRGQWADGSVVHQEDQQVGTVAGYVQQTNMQNQQAWDKRFAQQQFQGQAVQVQHQPQQQPMPQQQVLTSSTAGMSGMPRQANQGPRFIQHQPPPVMDHATMNPMLAGGSNVEPQDARVVASVPIRVPAKQTANIATGKMNNGQVAYDREGKVAPRPGMVTAYSNMDAQGTAGLGVVRDKHGNVIGQSGQFGQQYGQFGPGQFQGQQGHGLQPAFQQPQQGSMPPGQMMQEGIVFQTQGVGQQAQQATGTYHQASGQAFGGGEQIVGRVGQTRGQVPAGPGQVLDPQGNPMTPAARQNPTETPVMRGPDGSPIIVAGPNGQPMMLMQGPDGSAQYVTPMVVAGPDGMPQLVPPGQTVSEEQMMGSVPETETGDIDPEQIELVEQPQVTEEHQQLAAEAAPTPAAAPEPQGPPELHPEAAELLKGRKPVKEMATRVIGAKMFWPNFPDNWPFKSKAELRMKLAELHAEHPACLKAIYMAESTGFQAKMLEKWPDLLTA
jgi:hypothetical protein